MTSKQHINITPKLPDHPLLSDAEASQLCFNKVYAASLKPRVTANIKGVRPWGSVASQLY